MKTDSVQMVVKAFYRVEASRMNSSSPLVGSTGGEEEHGYRKISPGGASAARAGDCG